MKRNQKHHPRYWKRHLYKFQESLKFKTGHISTGGKVVVFSSIVVFLSLWMNRVDSQSGEFFGSSFAKISGKPGILILLFLGFVFFSLFSINKKEKLQVVSSIYFRDYTSCILAGVFITIISINSLNYAGGLQIFESDIIAGSGPILSLCGALLMTAGGFLMKYENGNNTKGTFIADSQKDESNSQKKEKNNMKLPF